MSLGIRLERRVKVRGTFIEVLIYKGGFIKYKMLIKLNLCIIY